MLTIEGRAYLEGALFLLSHAFTENPVEDYELAEYLAETAPELNHQTRQVIAFGLMREAENPERLKKDLIKSGWLEEIN